MAKNSPKPELIEEIEGGADRLATWISTNAWAVAGTLVAVLGAALAWGIYDSSSKDREEAASNALDKTQSAYFRALGAEPRAREEPELANPAAAKEIREEHLERFLTLANERENTVAGTLALFEAAQILERLERQDESDALWQRALATSAENPGLQGLVQQRIGTAHEARGDWGEAARAHEAAGAIDAYPLRYWALVDAARCWTAAGDDSKALELYERVNLAVPDIKLPTHLRAQYGELKAAEPAPAASP
ncbi:MAG: hypothetical protein QF890_00870 [Myxococcota bacterium]|nr:hypothetical protein [bacterium]MDP6075263.1 hypothetical protein [Myxococcota bacterium]MDP6244082.1 hypothetical protein [Myxococcota bacterium]MDP7074262.1 hypothetical protein [Myxococcota bacterium]MDP7300951.1 hypothetical protein [Myxococcota bacterium]